MCGPAHVLENLPDILAAAALLALSVVAHLSWPLIPSRSWLTLPSQGWHAGDPGHLGGLRTPSIVSHVQLGSPSLRHLLLSLLVAMGICPSVRLLSACCLAAAEPDHLISLQVGVRS